MISLLLDKQIFASSDARLCHNQGLVKGAKICFRYPYFYFWHGESTSTASQLTSPASQKSKDLNKVLLLLQDLGLDSVIHVGIEKYFQNLGASGQNSTKR